jgi:hypothetical protein
MILTVFLAGFTFGLAYADYKIEKMTKKMRIWDHWGI